MIKTLALAAGCMLVCPLLSAQRLETDSIPLTSSFQYALTEYDKVMRDELLVRNGSEHKTHSNPAKGFQYFQDWKFMKGNLVYDQVLYRDVPLLYDLYRDEVITESVDGVSKIRLVSEKVTSFAIEGHEFVRISAPDRDKTIVPGFYELLYDGSAQVFCKRIKRLTEVNTGQTLIEEFRQKDYYYIRIGQVYYPVRSGGAALKVFREYKSEIGKYLKANKVRFKSDPEKALKMIAQHYEELSAK